MDFRGESSRAISTKSHSVPDTHTHTHKSFSGGSGGKESAFNTGDLGSISG